jgi:hypothetical protein
LLRDLKRRPRPIQGCRADDDDDLEVAAKMEMLMEQCENGNDRRKPK